MCLGRWWLSSSSFLFGEVMSTPFALLAQGFFLVHFCFKADASKRLAKVKHLRQRRKKTSKLFLVKHFARFYTKTNYLFMPQCAASFLQQACNLLYAAASAGTASAS